MYPIPGHVGLALLFHRYLRVEIIALIAGAMLPDIIDKPLNDVFHITPYGRYAMHSFMGLFITSGLTWWILSRDTAFAYFLGHFSHLLGDADFNPWFLPFVSYDFPAGIDTTDILSDPGSIFFPSWILMETVLLGLVLFLYTRYAKKTSVQIAVLAAIAGIAVFRITRQRPS
ncbi:MAG: metal-dependent hydrolase [bacterium]|jgi:hypothetical protein